MKNLTTEIPFDELSDDFFNDYYKITMKAKVLEDIKRFQKGKEIISFGNIFELPYDDSYIYYLFPVECKEGIIEDGICNIEVDYNTEQPEDSEFFVFKADGI